MIKIPQNISLLSEKSVRSTLIAVFQRENFLPGCSSCLGCSEISSCPFNDIIMQSRIQTNWWVLRTQLSLILH